MKLRVIDGSANEGGAKPDAFWHPSRAGQLGAEYARDDNDEEVRGGVALAGVHRWLEEAVAGWLHAGECLLATVGCRRAEADRDLAIDSRAFADSRGVDGSLPAESLGPPGGVFLCEMALGVTDRRLLVFRVNPATGAWRIHRTIRLECVIGIRPWSETIIDMGAMQFDVVFVDRAELAVEAPRTCARSTRRFARTLGELTSIVDRELPSEARTGKTTGEGVRYFALTSDLSERFGEERSGLIGDQYE